MNLPSIFVTPQRRKASVSSASSSPKRAQRISTLVNSKIVGDLAKPHPSLDGLPEELVLHAFSYLKKEPLAMLGRTSRRCKRIADEVLYERVEDWLPSRAKMVETLADNPRLAEHVKDISLANWQGWTKLPVETTTKIEALKDCEASTRMIQSAINVRCLKVICQDDDSDAYREDLVRDYGWLQLFDDVARSVAGRSLNPFTHLKELHIIGNGKVTIEDIEPVFRLPSLHKLMLTHLIGPFPIDNWEVPESSSSIKVLGMTSSFISSVVVAQMLASIKSLEAFRCRHTTNPWRPLGPEEDPRSFWAHVSWSELGDALRRHKSSLACIAYTEYGVNSWQEEVYPGGRNPGTLGSLKDFSQLKQISGPVEMFLGVDLADDELAPILPVGLEHLSLFFAKFPEDSQSLVLRQALLSLIQGVLAEPLKSVQVMIPDGLPIGSLRLADAMEALQQQGTEVIINGVIDFWRELQLDELREIEAEHEEESESESESGSESEDEMDDGSEEEDQE